MYIYSIHTQTHTHAFNIHQHRWSWIPVHPEQTWPRVYKDISSYIPPIDLSPATSAVQFSPYAMAPCSIKSYNIEIIYIAF